jgi:hypothetical protein
VSQEVVQGLRDELVKVQQVKVLQLDLDHFFRNLKREWVEGMPEMQQRLACGSKTSFPESQESPEDKGRCMVVVSV